MHFLSLMRNMCAIFFAKSDFYFLVINKNRKFKTGQFFKFMKANYKFYNAHLSPLTKIILFGNDLAVCNGTRTPFIYAVAFGEEPFAILANRLQSYLAVNEDLHNSSTFATELAERGFYYNNGYVQCYSCQRRRHFDDVLLGQHPEHTTNCTAEHGPAGESIFAHFWGKPD